MSAFICGPDHFKAIAIFAASRGDGERWRVDPRYVDGLTHPEAQSRGLENFNDYELATMYADILYQENIRSVRERYPDDKWDELPGPCIKPLHIVVKPCDYMAGKYLRVKPIEVLVALNSWEYQSCETEDFRTTVAYRLAERIRRAAIRALPGYDKASEKFWDYYPDEARAA